MTHSLGSRQRLFGMACVRLAVSAALVAALSSTALAAPSTMLRGHEQQVQTNSQALGVSVGINGMLGFAYRRYVGNHAIQLSALPLMADGGDYLSLRFGAEYIHYALAWPGSGSGLLTASTTALRLVLATGVNIENESEDAIEVPDENCTTPQCKAIVASSSTVTTTAAVAAGFGFEFGAVRRPGFSLSLDVMMTARWDNEGFVDAYPLPYGALMYSW